MLTARLEVQMIDNLNVSIISYDLPALKEEDLEDLKNFIVEITQCGFEYSIINGNNPRKEMS